MKGNRSSAQRREVVGRAVSAIEGLEDRRMLSAVSPEDRVLVIEGTRRSDSITIDRSGKKSVAVNVNGVKSTFAFKQFGKIRVVLGKGNDFVRVGTADRPIAVKTVADAGEGNDTVYTGAGDDSVTGGDGDDSLMGYSGRDTVRGGAGNDQIWGGDDNDTCYGDLGADSIVAGAGDDLAYGNRGNDALWDGAGTDSVYGNKGNDRYVVNANRKEFKDRGAAEVCEKEPVSVGTGIGALGGSGSFIKVGSNTFAGSTTVNGGTLVVRQTPTGAGGTLRVTDATGSVIGNVSELTSGSSAVLTSTNATAGSGFVIAGAEVRVVSNTTSGLLKTSTTSAGGTMNLSVTSGFSNFAANVSGSVTNLHFNDGTLGIGNGSMTLGGLNGTGASLIFGPGTLVIGTPTIISESGLTLTVPRGTRLEVPGEAATAVGEGTTRTVTGGASLWTLLGQRFTVAASVTVTVTGGDVPYVTILRNTVTPPPADPVPPVNPVPPADPVPPVDRPRANWRPSVAVFEGVPASDDAGTETVGIGDNGTADGGLTETSDDPAGANGTVTEGDGGLLFV